MLLSTPTDINCCLKTTETAAEKTSDAKAEPMATEESTVTASTTEPTESATDAGKVEKPSENGTAESTAEAPPKLFVGRLPIGTKDAQLKELFGTYGEVTHCDIVGKYGFVVSYHQNVSVELLTNCCFSI